MPPGDTRTRTRGGPRGRCPAHGKEGLGSALLSRHQQRALEAHDGYCGCVNIFCDFLSKATQQRRQTGGVALCGGSASCGGALSVGSLTRLVLWLTSVTPFMNLQTYQRYRWYGRSTRVSRGVHVYPCGRQECVLAPGHVYVHVYHVTPFMAAAHPQL